jgi:hypothetical protein
MPAKPIVFAFIVMASLTADAIAADEFPYEAYVAVEQAEVVAGPWHRFYATDRLARGTKIEIYREEPSGWLAIRPPEGAFSWTPAESIERLKDDPTLGRIKQPAPAWIGTAAEHVSEHRQQVTLKTGEMVQILGEKSVGAGEGRQKWLKIAPPAGEFRWIHLRDVSRQMPEVESEIEAPADFNEGDRRGNLKALTLALSQRERGEAEEPRRLPVGGRAIALQEIEAARDVRFDRDVAPAQFASAAGGSPKSLSPDGFVARKRRTGDSTTPMATAAAPNFRASNAAPIRQPIDAAPRIAASVPPARAQPVSASAPASSGASDEYLQQQLEQIEVDLSLMVAQDRSQWSFAPLRERVQQLIEQGADPAARGRARLTLDKIKQFEEAFDVAGFGPVGRIAGPQAAANAPASGALNTSGAAPAEKDSLADPRYDAQGWLKPVVSRKSDKPAAPYAVVDQEGQPLCFVTPSPGLNLNRYLNKQVGVYGRRGMLEELHKPHVLAERVIDLDRQWR